MPSLVRAFPLLGPARLSSENGFLVSLEIGVPGSPSGAPADPLLEEAASRLQAWLSGHPADLGLPVAPRGTPFRRAVWRVLLGIPRGRVLSYGEIAEALGSPGAARAVGGACGANPLPIFVPCHRAVAAGGRLGGFGPGLPLKAALLALEGRRLSGGRLLPS